MAPQPVPILYKTSRDGHHPRMRTTLQSIFCALGLCLALEGALWALFPGMMRRVMRELVEKSPEALRRYGLLGIGLGLLLVALFR